MLMHPSTRACTSSGEVEEFVYLGVLFDEEGGVAKDIQQRLK